MELNFRTWNQIMENAVKSWNMRSNYGTWGQIMENGVESFK